MSCRRARGWGSCLQPQSPAAVHSAARALSLVEPLAEAEARGLVGVDGDRVVFRHPLVRALWSTPAPSMPTAAQRTGRLPTRSRPRSTVIGKRDTFRGGDGARRAARSLARGATVRLLAAAAWAAARALERGTRLSRDPDGVSACRSGNVLGGGCRPWRSACRGGTCRRSGSVGAGLSELQRSPRGRDTSRVVTRDVSQRAPVAGIRRSHPLAESTRVPGRCPAWSHVPRPGTRA